MNSDNNEIVKWNTEDGEEYTFWTRADFIRDEYIIDFLKGKFPGKLVIRELNMIDLTVLEENLPIEIQATPAVRDGNNRPAYSSFEQKIEKQISQDIASYGMCWFFFDSELLRAMRNAGRRMSINMVWFRNYMKEGKLKVFAVSHDGIIEEKQYKDFDFLSDVSQTCKVAAKTDDMILNENKIKIFSNIVNGYEFAQEEIDKFYNDWREYCKTNKIDSEDKNDVFVQFLKKQKDDRTKLYGNILHAISSLSLINKILGLKNYNSAVKYHASKLGIFDIEGSTYKSITRFVNRFNVCQYFPGYMRNKETWDSLKGHNLNPRQFEGIVKNGIGNYFWYKDDKSQDDKSHVLTESKQTNDKDINVTIESKDQIITVNAKSIDQLKLTIIKDKTKQENIDDAWGQKYVISAGDLIDRVENSILEYVSDRQECVDQLSSTQLLVFMHMRLAIVDIKYDYVDNNMQALNMHRDVIWVKRWVRQ